MAQWVLRVKVLSESKGRKFKPEPELFCIFSKIFEIFIKTTFLGVKKHEEHESGVKKIITQRKTI